MILPTVIESFLKRPLDNTDKTKRKSEAWIDRRFAKLKPQPKFRFPPFLHQKICFLLGIKFPGFFFMLDMGLGKTKVAIDVFRYRKRCRQVTRMLVLVPSTSNVDAWRRELEIHAPKLRVGLLDASANAKRRQELFFESDVDVLVCTYRGLCVLLCGGARINPNSAQARLTVKPKLKAQCVKRFDMIVADESSYFKNHQSLIFRVLRSLSNDIPYRYCLSGTPSGADQQDLWSQFYFCDRGETLGQTLGLFRAAFFSCEETRWALKWKLQKRRAPKLYRTLRHRSIRYEEIECLDLPKMIGGIRKPMFRVAYKSTEQIIAHDREFQALKDALVTGDPLDAPYYRMRAVTSGYIPCEDKQFIDFKTNPKIDVLLEILNECAGKKVLVFFQYVHTADLIKRALAKEKICCVEVSGRVSKKAEAITAFEGPVNVMLGNRAAVYGLNLQFCNRAIFFETPDSIKERKQAEKRIHRHGQKRTVYIYDIVMPGSVDDRIIEALKHGKSVFDTVIDGIETGDG